MRVLGLAALAAVLFFPMQALAEWRRAESDHFIVHSDRGERELRDYVVVLEDFDALLRSRHTDLVETVKPPKLNVYLVGSISQIRRVWPQAPDRVGGFYTASYGGIFALAIRDAGGDMDGTKGDDVVLHEYVHHFMRQYHNASYPAWLVEGYAEYYATADMAPKKITIGNVHPGRAYALRQPGWLGMDQVLSKPVNELSTSDKGAFYAQSWLLTHYIMSDNARRQKLNVYLRAWRKDGDSIAAWKAAFGETPEELRRSLDRYRSKPLMGRIITRDAPSTPPMVVTTLPAAADDVLLESLQLQITVPAARRPDLLQKLRAVHARRPTDPFARLTVARAETKFGDRDAGEILLKALIAEDPQNHEAMLALAESHLARGRSDTAVREEQFAAARRMAAAAMRIRPEDYRIYAITAQTRVGERGPPSENTLNVLIRGVQLAPQVRELRTMAAATFMRVSGAEDEVRELLEPLLSDPHGGRMTTNAQAMIARLDGKPAPQSTDPEPDGDEEEDE